MTRKLALFFLVAILALTTLIDSIHIKSVSANTGEEIEKEIENFKQQQGDKEEAAEQTEEELQEIEAEMEGVAEEIHQLDNEMLTTNQNIDEKQEELDATNERVEELRDEIIVLEERIKERDEILKERVKFMYQNGGSIDYIDVILGAQSFGDLLERVSALNSIAESDRKILEQHIEDMQALEKAKNDLESELASLEDQMADLEDLKQTLEAQIDQKDVLLEQLIEQGYSLEDNLLNLEEEQQFLAAQEEAAKQELAAWEEEQRRLEEERLKKEAEEKRQREEEERRQAEAEEERRAEERAAENAEAEEEREAQAASASSNSSSSSSSNSSSNSNSGSSSSSSAENTTTQPSGGSATFQRPANGRVTSGYNPNRVHPVTGNVRSHNGTDFGRDGGTGIYAAEAGTVISAGWMNGYGNTITISHVVNGKSVTTLYAHLASMNVSAGDRVSRGQTIAVMGTTGVSTGVHLHFEVHPGGYSGSSSAVNPSSYLP